MVTLISHPVYQKFTIMTVSAGVIYVQELVVQSFIFNVPYVHALSNNIFGKSNETFLP